MARWLPCLLLMLASTCAHAVDGCKALLCFADPGDPRSIPACRATVDEVLDLLAHGGSFPRCDMAATPGAPSVVTGAQRYYPCAQSYGDGWTEAPNPPHQVVQAATCVIQVPAIDASHGQLPPACTVHPCVVPSIPAGALGRASGTQVAVRLPAQPTPGPDFIDIIIDPTRTQRFWWSPP